MDNNLTEFVYNAITEKTQEKNFFAIDGDIIYNPENGKIIVLMENGEKYEIQINKI